jgi:hypothetical protein
MDPESAKHRVPITLKHFKLLAHLGRAPVGFSTNARAIPDVQLSQPLSLIDDIESGSEFFFTEEDYLTPEELSGTPNKKAPKKKGSRSKAKTISGQAVKTERSSPTTITGADSSFHIEDSLVAKKRPRRSAASSSKKYVVPDSDDDMIVDECDIVMHEATCFAKKRKIETHLQKWIKHLTALLQEEQRKVGTISS